MHNCIFHSVAAMKLEPCLLSIHTPPTNPFASLHLNLFVTKCMTCLQTCQSTHIAGHIYFLFLVAKCKWTLMSNRYSLDCITIAPVPNLFFFLFNLLKAEEKKIRLVASFAVTVLCNYLIHSFNFIT